MSDSVPEEPRDEDLPPWLRPQHQLERISEPDSPGRRWLAGVALLLAPLLLAGGLAVWGSLQVQQLQEQVRRQLPQTSGQLTPEQRQAIEQALGLQR